MLHEDKSQPHDLLYNKCRAVPKGTISRDYKLVRKHVYRKLYYFSHANLLVNKVQQDVTVSFYINVNQPVCYSATRNMCMYTVKKQKILKN